MKNVYGVQNIAEFIAKYGDDNIDYESLMDMADRLGLPDDISYESTEAGRKEFGNLLIQTRKRCRIRNPYAKLRDAGISRKHDGRQLSARPISRKNFSALIEKCTGIKLSPDVLRKAEIGESINDQTLFKIATARFVLHPVESRALELSEMIDILREELTIADMEGNNLNQESGIQRSRRRRASK